MSTGQPDIIANPRQRPPLGLPTGSVRALLALTILAVVVFETVRGRPLDEIWSETLLIALAHYFTSRRFVGLPPDALRRLEDEGHIPRESNPLFLPRHSIRAIIILAFAGLAYYVFGVQQVRQFDLVPPILVTVGSYLLGVLARPLLAGRTPESPSRLWEDVKALTVILVLLATAIPYFLDHGSQVPHHLRSLTLAFVLFYFGSR